MMTFAFGRNWMQSLNLMSGDCGAAEAAAAAVPERGA